MKTIFIFLLCASSVFAQTRTKTLSLYSRSLSATTTADTTNSTTTFKWTPLSVTLDSNATYCVYGRILTGKSDAAGMSVGVHFPANTTVNLQQYGTDSTLKMFNSANITADSTAGYSCNNANAQTGWCTLSGEIVTGATSGSFIVMHKANASGVATMRAKSYIILTRIK